MVIKADGLGHDTLAHWVNQRNPETGKSYLPWIHRVFVQGGTVFENFCVRGISLSVP